MKFSSSKRDEFYDDNDGANNDDNDVDVDDVRLQTEKINDCRRRCNLYE